MKKNTEKNCRICPTCKIYPCATTPNGDITAYCVECRKMHCREWYKIKKILKIKNSKKYQKLTNYSCEKTKKERKKRYIKRETRRKYPLKNKFCEFCGKTATEHHHNTNPIEINKFNYICHDCHFNNEKGGIIKHGN